MTSINQTIRMARPDDAAAMLAIYEPIVRETVTSFEIEPPPLDEFRHRVASGLETHPWLVAEVDNSVVGYAYAGPFRTRWAYQWTTEVSVYVHQGCHHRGVGSSLYTALFDILEKHGFKTIVAGIALPNPASVALHQRLGFEPVGVFPRVGFKFGRWVDVGWWSRRLSLDDEPLTQGPRTPNRI